MSPDQEALVVDHMRLAGWVARDFRTWGMEAADVRQLAMEGLVLAALKFDEDKASFATWATWVMRHHLLKAHRRQSPHRRAMRCPPVDDDSLARLADAADGGFDGVDAIVDFERLDLSDRDQAMLRMLSGGATQREAAASIGVSQMQVSRILKSLRERMAA